MVFIARRKPIPQNRLAIPVLDKMDKGAVRVAYNVVFEIPDEIPPTVVAHGHCQPKANFRIQLGVRDAMKQHRASFWLTEKPFLDLESVGEGAVANWVLVVRNRTQILLPSQTSDEGDIDTV